uniref:Cytochrome c oxidase subunit 2 n=1 Tax=Diplosoma listerianum TaxID=168635 RepID=D1GL02_9ASCI|nr:cytochrome c oxidase subunit 2 [Diplosoma listerianum]
MKKLIMIKGDSINIMFFLMKKKIFLLMMYGRMNLMDGVSMVSQNMMMFHQFCLSIIMTILVGVCLLSFICIKKKNLPVKILYNASVVEFTWTVLPMFFLLSLGGPCFYMLYSIEGEVTNYSMDVKITGHQWYWSYEGNDYLGKSFSFDSYMKDLNELKMGHSRLLEVDNHLLLPYKHNIRLLITSSDVLHSWALPKMALKVDAIPGRLNMMSIRSMTPGSFYGQCSEICGVNHSFMPIHVQFTHFFSDLTNVYTNDQLKIMNMYYYEKMKYIIYKKKLEEYYRNKAEALKNIKPKINNEMDDYDELYKYNYSI